MLKQPKSEEVMILISELLNLEKWWWSISDRLVSVDDLRYYRETQKEIYIKIIDIVDGTVNGKEVRNMLVSKYKAKNGKTYINVVVHKNFIKDTNNGDYKAISLSDDFIIGLDGKNSIKLSELVNLDKLADNTAKK